MNTSVSQRTCLPIATEFGHTPDPNIIAELHELSGYLADELTTKEARPGDKPGHAAERTIASLGCTACEMGVEGNCSVSDVLHTEVAAGQEEQALLHTTNMLASSPAWLTAARLNLSGTSPSVLHALDSPQAVKTALSAKTFVPQEFLCNTTNQPGPIYADSDLTELAHISSLKSDEPLLATEVTTDKGATFIVVDASTNLDFHGQPPSEADYGILTGKLLNRMRKADSTGKSQIETADNKMQKVIGHFGPSTMFELRMNGKNRLYFMYTPNKGDEPPRIVILGCHGGNEATQKKFIRSATT